MKDYSVLVFCNPLLDVVLRVHLGCDGAGTPSVLGVPDVIKLWVRFRTLLPSLLFVFFALKRTYDVFYCFPFRFILLPILDSLGSLPAL